MSWGEVFKINNNIKKPFNELLCDAMYTPIRIITTTGTYTPERTGKYRIICIGAGADSNYSLYSSTFYLGGGGAGGVAIKDMRLLSSDSYNVTIGTTASFGNTLTATGGTQYRYSSSSAIIEPVGGTASGGDYNYTGGSGITGKTASPNSVDSVNGGSVGVDIGELTRQYVFNNRVNTERRHGKSILRYGGGGSHSIVKDNGDHHSKGTGFPAAILIIPLEMEE